MFDMFPRTLSSATGFYFNSIERLSLLPFVAAHQSRHFWIRSEKHMFHNEMVHTHIPVSWQLFFFRNAWMLI